MSMWYLVWTCRDPKNFNPWDLNRVPKTPQKNLVLFSSEA